MTYHFDSVRTQTHLWPGTSTAYDFHSRQDIYKTNVGSKRSETPYFRDVSSFTGGSRFTKSGSTPISWPTCRGTGWQNINGIVDEDLYVLRPRALNRARQAFIEACKESRQTSIGSSLAEYRQVLDMMGDRALQLLNFGRCLRRGQFGKAASVLGIRLPKGWRTKGKSLGDLWLELHFGWVPLLSDIHEGMDLISDPLSSDGPCRGRGRAKDNANHLLVYNFADGSLMNKRWVSGQFEALAELRGDTELENPNLDLLQNLGIINPAAVAWELVPFSFLVDHVVSIGDFLSSFSDTIGWKVTNLAQSTLSVCRGGSMEEKIWTADGNTLTRSLNVTGNAAYMVRGFPGALPPYTLAFRNPFTGLSAPRAATYIALLLQVM